MGKYLKMDWTPEKVHFAPDEIKLFESNAVDGAIRRYSLQEIISNSEKFPIKFPVDSGRLATLIQKVRSNVNKIR